MISAYFFYLVIDFIPKVKRENRTIVVLNLLICSVLDAFDRARMFGHETPIYNVKTSMLEKEWLEKNITDLKSNGVPYLKLKYAMETSHSRLEDFRHALSLAVTLSPEKSVEWLIITDKIRLLADEYENIPHIPKDKRRYIDVDSDENPIRNYKSLLNFRALEIIEHAYLWSYGAVARKWLENG